MYSSIDAITRLSINFENDCTKMYHTNEQRREKTCLTRSDTIRAVQPQRMAIGLKFRIYEVEGKQRL